MIIHLSLLSWQCSSFAWQHFAEIAGHPDFSQLTGAADLAHHVRRVCPQTELAQLMAGGSAWFEQNQRWLEWGSRRDIHFLYPGHPDYPMSYLHLEEPPLALAFRGQACWRARPCLAVVGSREPLPVSLFWMEQELGHFLKTYEVVTVSGGARGIDQKCHSLSIRHGRPTVVAIPSGLARLYPRNLSDWLQPVLEGGGAFLSCFAPEREMFKWQFQRRNQLIAQLAQTLLIVEAGLRSGTYMTAQLALERESPIGVVPGHPSERKFQGSMALMRALVPPICDVQDLVNMMSPWLNFKAQLSFSENTLDETSGPGATQTPIGGAGEDEIS